MILADKIIALRKKAGWSQEELANELNVSRQSVSKWEGAQSIPDMDKIIQMSKIFNVTTDFLLKDEIEEFGEILVDEKSDKHYIKLSDATNYLHLMKSLSPKLAFSVFLCIISPIALIMLGAFCENEELGCGIGLVILIGLVSIAVVNFIMYGAKVKEYEFLEKEKIETEYGVVGVVKERKKEFNDTYQRLMTIGVILCIFSVVPPFISLCINNDSLAIVSVGLLLFIVSVGVYLLVYARNYQSAIERLLEEGDYSPKKKEKKDLISLVTVSYWLLVTAIFLFMILGPFSDYSKNWIIWPIAGVLFGIIIIIIDSVNFKKK